MSLRGHSLPEAISNLIMRLLRHKEQGVARNDMITTEYSHAS